MSSPVLFLDFETRSACDIKTAGADVYARHPSTELLCVGYAYDVDEAADVCTKPHKFLDDVGILRRIEAGEMVVAHNAPFELAIWNHVGVRQHGWPELKPEQMICTMAMAYAMALPGSLEKAAAAVGIEKQKDMKGQRTMLQLSQPREILPSGEIIWWEDEEKSKILFEYCRTDVEVERELYKRLLPLSPSERELWLLDYKINQRGIQLDLPSINVAITLVDQEKQRLDARMREVTGNQVASCTATTQLTNWLKQEGVETDGVAKSAVLELLSLSTLSLSCREALLLRQEAAKSSTAKLEAMKARACSDGRVRSTTQYHGAGTGRWAGRGIQVQNFPRGELGEKEVEEVFKLLEAWS